MGAHGLLTPQSRLTLMVTSLFYTGREKACFTVRNIWSACHDSQILDLKSPVSGYVIFLFSASPLCQILEIYGLGSCTSTATGKRIFFKSQTSKLVQDKKNTEAINYINRIRDLNE